MWSESVNVRTLLALLLAFGVSAVQTATADRRHAVATDIQWHAYDEGVHLARTEGKPVMLVFTAKWCGWCRKLEEETLSKDSIIALSADFVCVKVDVDEESELARSFRVRGIPVVLFTDEDGNELRRVVGFADEAELIDEMLKALDAVGRTPSASIQVPAEKTKRTVTTLAPLLSVFIAYILRRSKKEEDRR